MKTIKGNCLTPKGVLKKDFRESIVDDTTPDLETLKELGFNEVKDTIYVKEYVDSFGVKVYAVVKLTVGTTSPIKDTQPKGKSVIEIS